MGKGNPELSKLHMGQRWVYDIDCPVHELDEAVHTAAVKGKPRWLILVARGE